MALGFPTAMSRSARARARLRCVVFLRPSGADRFPRCPVCGSSALNAVSHEDVGDSLDEWSARCAECQSWRTRVLARWETRELPAARDGQARLTIDRRQSSGRASAPRDATGSDTSGACLGGAGQPEDVAAVRMTCPSDDPERTNTAG